MNTFEIGPRGRGRFRRLALLTVALAAVALSVGAGQAHVAAHIIGGGGSSNSNAVIEPNHYNSPNTWFDYSGGWSTGMCNQGYGGSTVYHSWGTEYGAGTFSWSARDLDPRVYYKIVAYMPPCASTGTNPTAQYYLTSDATGAYRKQSAAMPMNQNTAYKWTYVGYAYSGDSGAIDVTLSDRGDPAFNSVANVLCFIQWPGYKDEHSAPIYCS